MEFRRLLELRGQSLKCGKGKGTKIHSRVIEWRRLHEERALEICRGSPLRPTLKMDHCMQGGILSPGNRIGRDLEKGNMRREIGICVVKIWQVMVGPYIPLLQTLLAQSRRCTGFGDKLCVRS